MSGVLENRAAVFTREPQEVEVHQDGVWWPGSLLGWRHDAHGSCQVWVRVTVGGAETSTWTGLEALRLPSAHPGAPVAVEAGGRPARDTLADPTATRQLRPFEAGVPGSRRGGRPAVPPSSSAVTAIAVERSPEPVPARRPATSSGDRPSTSGRHRAPAATGRHRAADTETFPAVTDDEPLATRESWTIEMSGRWPVVVEDPWAGSDVRTSRGAAESDPGPFTRPLRLKPLGAGALPQPRAALWDGRSAPV